MTWVLYEFYYTVLRENLEKYQHVSISIKIIKYFHYKIDEKSVVKFHHINCLIGTTTLTCDWK